MSILFWYMNSYSCKLYSHLCGSYALVLTSSLYTQMGDTRVMLEFYYFSLSIFSISNHSWPNGIAQNVRCRSKSAVDCSQHEHPPTLQTIFTHKLKLSTEKLSSNLESKERRKQNRLVRFISHICFNSLWFIRSEKINTALHRWRLKRENINAH